MELKVIKQQEVLGKEFKVYGDFENPLFLAKDIANWIEYSEGNPSHMCSMVDESEVVKLFCSINNGTKPTESIGEANRLFLTEDGLYEVLMQSRKPIAKEFKKEVKTILKEVRKTGGYIATNENETDEEILAKAIIVANRTIERKNQKIAELETKITKDEPLVEFANKVAKSSDSIDIGDFSKVLHSEEIKIGRNTLFSWLRENKYIMKNNIPYQKYVDNGYFEVIEVVKTTPWGDKVFAKTLITGNGQIYLVQKLRDFK